MSYLSIRLLACFAIAAQTAVVAGCAADTSDAAEDDENGSSEDELRGNAKKVAGAYEYVDSTRHPAFTYLKLKNDGTFDATVDTGLRCITTPCPSNVGMTGTFKATKSYLTLSAADGQAVEYYGRYKYTLSGDTLSLSRKGAAWADWGNTMKRAEQRPVWPSNATQLVAESSGGGFTPPPPEGSECTTWGRAKYTFDVDSKKLAWERCSFNGSILKAENGDRILSATNVGKIEAALAKVEISDRNVCGADKPMKKIVVSTPGSSTTYKDDFYSCQGEGQFVSNIDAIFSTLGKLVTE